MDLSKTIGEQSGNAKNHLDAVAVNLFLRLGSFKINKRNACSFQWGCSKPKQRDSYLEIKSQEQSFGSQKILEVKTQACRKWAIDRRIIPKERKQTEPINNDLNQAIKQGDIRSPDQDFLKSNSCI